MQQANPRKPAGPLGGWREHAAGIGKMLIGRWTMLPVLMGMVIGAAMVSSVVGFFTDTRNNSDLNQGLTQIAPGVVEAAWWRLGFSPDELDGASNWAIYVDPSFCVRTRQVQAREQAAVSCLSYQRVLDIFDAPYQLQVLGGEEQGIWRDADGDLALGIHMPKAGWEYLQQTATPYQDYQPPWRPYPGVPPEGEASYWEAFRVDFEQPADQLLRLYQSDPVLDLAVDPQDPSRAAPAFFLDQEEYVDIKPFVAAVGAFGAVFWAVSFNMFLGSTARSLRLVIVALSLVSAPWWGSYVWRALDLMMKDASGIGQMLQGMLVQRPPKLEIFAPDYGGEAGDHVELYKPSTSLYRSAFDGITLTVPDEPVTLPAAKALIQEQVDQSLEQMTPSQRARFFEKQACLSSNGFRGAGDLFVESAEGWLDDAEAGEMASRFLRYQNDSGVQFNDLDCDEQR